MNTQTLYQAIARMAALTHSFTDADLGQPWAWRFHQEGVRFAFLGSYQELCELATQLAHQRAQQGPPLTQAQRILSQVHAAYRDLQAILVGVTEEAYGREPAPGEWPLRYVLGHTIATERTFFTLIHYGLERQRDGGERPSRLPDGEVERVTGSSRDFRDMMETQGLPEMLAYYDALHQRKLREFTSITDEELQGPSLWWEGEELPLSHRLHRFDAHLRQHAIQAEKTLVAVGSGPNEAKRLLRLLYQALAQVESATLGAANLGISDCEALAATIMARAEEVAVVVQQAHEMVTAVQTDNLDKVKDLLTVAPRLVNATGQSGLPVVMLAAYYGRPAIVSTLVDAGAELSIFEAAAIGKLDVVQQAVQDWPGWINEYARDGFMPLQLACFFGQEAIALWLIEQGADVNAVARNDRLIRPIHAAAAGGNMAVLRALLDKGADVNVQQEGGFTPLHEAANSGNLEMVQLFLAHGADASVSNSEGQTPLDLARERGHEAIVALLQALN